MPEAPDFFRTLGMAVSQQLSKKLDLERTRATADRALRAHLSGRPMAQDAALPRAPHAYGGTGLDQDQPNGTHGCSAEEALDIVGKIMGGFSDDDERAAFITGLSNLVSQDANGNGNGGRANVPAYNNNQNAADARRRGAQDRRLANDAALRNAKGFAKRWGDIGMNISFSGTGR